jgi:aminoglycoside phosphotransferase (APT) family kinase protein
LADVPLVPVRGGLSNHAWWAPRGERGCFVRLGGPHSASLGVDRDSECVLLGAVAEAGLAPKVLACDPSNGLLVTDFVPGGAWRREDAREPGNVRRLGALIRALHRLPAAAGVRHVSFSEQAARLEAELASAGETDAVVQRIAAEAFDALRPRPAIVTLCHNDLHHLNVLDDGVRLWLVDWEYGGRGDPLFDLASFLCQHESSPPERAALLEGYGDDGASAAELDAACAAFDYVQWLWYRLWAVRHPEANGEYLARADALAVRLAGTGAA